MHRGGTGLGTHSSPMPGTTGPFTPTRLLAWARLLAHSSTSLWTWWCASHSAHRLPPPNILPNHYLQLFYAFPTPPPTTFCLCLLFRGGTNAGTFTRHAPLNRAAFPDIELRTTTCYPATRLTTCPLPRCSFHGTTSMNSAGALPIGLLPPKKGHLFLTEELTILPCSTVDIRGTKHRLQPQF